MQRIMNIRLVPAIAALMLASAAGSVAAQSTGSHVGVAVKSSTLGIALEAAVAVAEKVNVRGGLNILSVNHTFDTDGATIGATLNMRSADVFLDWFPFGGGFHVSPGVLFYNGNKVSGNYTVSPGNQFSLNDQDYISDPKNPAAGTAKITLGKAGPALLLGWGNLVPRGDRHWAVPFEFGFVYTQAASATLNLSGNACALNGSNCRSIATDPTLQSNVASQEQKINDSLKVAKVYPVISAGFSYRF